MNLNWIDPKPISDRDDSTRGVNTPPETIADDFLNDHDPLGTPKLSNSSVPWPGSTFIIRCAITGKVITLVDGKIIIAPPGGRGAIYWACIETKGWYGFREINSGRFLGHDKNGYLCCRAERQQGWENFCVRMTPEGGYVLLMTHWERLWHVGPKMDKGVEMLVKVGEKMADGMLWEFVKV
ncbi:uncharacterized protein LY89DRAFT_679577 [Mollisia scopiformis]|uniref:Uncharacterized protein n=1 Tax=Mollisia scopiformis TaxID=149040 RepID=A0A194XVU2_MOLSC|nr:uncharacterized protein LY89DRAFT_679577 [Mollisia scopiformis]KUJ24435.1 hypothetical protein LY89DRAFT_679577 [Mollisia scopiformis]